jgi:hypothetical protein
MATSSPTAAGLTSVQRQYRAARDKSVPLVVMRTVDPAACVRAIEPVTRNEENKEAPLIQWTCTAGFEHINSSGQVVARNLGGEKITNPVEALLKAQGAPPSTSVVFQNLSDYWPDPRVRQAFWTLRDRFKANWRTAVAMGPDVAVPRVLEHDVLVIDEPLRGPDELATIVRASYVQARINKTPTDDDVRRAVDAGAGLSAFAFEQAVALSLRKEGLHFDSLRERHRQMIENTKGLSVWRGGETFAQVGGLREFIKFAQRFLSADVYRPGAVLFIDEIEKALAGVRGDLSGVSQDYLSTLLQYMANGSVPAILLMGHPGTGKSLLAKGFGGTAGVPTIHMDLGEMHGSLMGESQHALRHALKVSTAVSQGRPIVIATCNSVAVLPPELINRFTFRFFVDFPEDEEKDTIWPIHMTRLHLNPKQPRPAATNWNGREIEQCCLTAHQLKCTLLEAADYVVPIMESGGEEIERRRREAAGRYLSASYPGAFSYEPKENVKVGGRQIRVDDDAKWAVPGTGKLN